MGIHAQAAEQALPRRARRGLEVIHLLADFPSPNYTRHTASVKDTADDRHRPC
jgi:hypothetical protein